MDFLPRCITTTRCPFRPLMRLAIPRHHCLPYKASPPQRTAIHTVRLRRAPKRPLRRQARRQREIPRPRSGHARTWYHIPALRTAGDMRTWSRVVFPGRRRNPAPVLTVPTPDSLDVVQQPLRARMCGFGDKVRRRILLLCAAPLRADMLTDNSTGPATNHSATLCPVNHH